MPTVEASNAPEDANAAAKPATATARSTPTAKKTSPNSTPKKAGNGRTTPAIAPVKAKAAEKKKPEPTLLHDFLRGRPSTSRPTASRPRRKSSGIAHAEVKMSAVNKLDPPAKVKNRVMEWQKASRGAGAPEDFHLEQPTTEKEEDKPAAAPSQSAGPSKEASPPAPPTEGKKTPQPVAAPTKPKAATARKPKRANIETPMPPIARGAQMKRVVSDTHWVNKSAKKETPVIKDPIFNLLLNSGAVKKAASPKVSPPKPSVPKPPAIKTLPNDFTETNWANPPVERKIQDWVRRSAEASANGHEVDADAAAAYGEATKEAQKSRNSSKSPAKLEVPGGFRTAATSNKPTAALNERDSRGDVQKEQRADAANEKVAGARLPKKPERTRRVRAARPEEIAAALGLPPPGRRSPKQRREIDKKYDSEDLRRLPSYGARRENGRDRQLYHEEDDARQRNRETESYDKPYKYIPRSDRRSPDHYDDETNASFDNHGTPRRQASRTQQQKPRDEATTVTSDSLSTLTSDSETTEAPKRQEARRQQKKARDEATTVTADTLSTLTSDSESTLSNTASIRRDNMKRESKKSLGDKKPLDDIPVGYSAFSVLDLSPGGQPRTRPVKPLRKASLGVPNVLKRVYQEGMKIMQDTVDPPQIVIKNPPNIESWLNGTTDPCLDDPSKQPAGSQAKPEGSAKAYRERSPSYKPPQSINRGPLKEEIPTRTSSNSKTFSRSYDDREAGDRLRNSSLTESRTPRSDVLENIQEPYVGLKRRPAKRENTRAELKSTHELRSPEVARDLNSYADSLSRDSGRNPRTRPVSREFHGAKTSEPLHVDLDRRSSPRVAERTSPRSLTKNGDVDAKEAPQLTRHSRLRRIPSSGPATRKSRRHGGSDTLKPQESVEHPGSGQPSRFASSRTFEGSDFRRRLIKHSDLMSMLSLPDTNVQRGAIIASARSIRTKRAPIGSHDVRLILAEVKADEEKYVRELETLVDGVVPVLLGSVLARSNSVAVSHCTTSTDAVSSATTKSLVEMGDALTKLKTLHAQIPTNDPDRLTLWLISAHAAYSDYLNAWRLGFDDIVVHLAPATNTDGNNNNNNNNNTQDDGPISDMDSELVQIVGDLLGRPCARIKFLLKASRALYTACPSENGETAVQLWEGLLQHKLRRVKEENARKQDMRANNIDVSRARDLRTLSSATNSCINQFRQVKAKDYFELSLSHTNGQRLACEVEIIIRDGSSGDGDVLIREVDSQDNQWLLFPPIEMHQISARRADLEEDLLVMVKGYYDGKHWTEVFSLHADHADIAEEFLQMLRISPMSPPSKVKAEAIQSPPITPRSAMMSGGLQNDGMEYPIGEPAPKRSNGLKQDSITRFEHSTTTDHVYDKEKSALKPQRPGQSGSKQSQSTRQPSTPVVGPQSTQSQSSLEISPQSKRRLSSPLLKEDNPRDQLQPSKVYASAVSSDSYDSYFESDLTNSEEEDATLNRPLQQALPTRVSTPRSTPPPKRGYCYKFTAYLTCWRGDLGRYEELHKDICSIRVTPGRVRIMSMDASHSAPYVSDDDDKDRPLIELELNPTHVLAQRTGLDVEIRGDLLESSLLKPPSLSRVRSVPLLRLRSANTMACISLYRALEQARKDNARWKADDQARTVNAFGQQLHVENAEDFQNRRSWFSRKKSYRASARAPTVDSASSRFSLGNAFTALNRFKKDNRSFDIERSSTRSGGIFGRNRDSRASSQFNEDTVSNGFIPPSDSVDPSQATTGTIDTAQFDTTFMKIRLYMMHSGSSKWVDMGECQITISQPPEWMRETSSLYNGYQKRVTLTDILEESTVDKINKRFSNVLGGLDERVPEVRFDMIVGARCCGKAGRKGVVMQTWEELRGENGEIGQAPAQGGVCGRQQRYLLQSESTSQARFIFALLGAGGGAAQDL